MDAKTYSVFADASYSNDINIIKDKLVKAGLADWKVLKIDDEYVTSNINGFQGVAYGLDSNGDGEYEQIVVACRGSQPPTWTAPLEMLKDWLWADAVQIGSGSNLTQYDSAQDFYNKVLDEYCATTSENGTTIVDNSKLTITGHSMGGSLAQLLCAQYGNYGVTFNAPGTAFQANNMHWTGTNVDNYVIMNDIIGNIRDHVGTTRAIVYANFLVDQFNSKSNYQTPINPEVALLPTLKGYGVVEDLHIAMNENSELAECA